MSGLSWNQLFLDWIKELADAKSSGASANISVGRLQDTYMKAYLSLESCPKQFSHPSQLKELKFFGEKICSTLTKKLKIYCASEGIPVPNDPSTQVTLDWASVEAVDEDSLEHPGEKSTDVKQDKRKSKKKRKQADPKLFVPRHRSGGYAILLVLRDHEKSDHFHGQGLGKSDIIRNAKAKEYCDTSFESGTNTGNFYSAWNSVNTLVKNGLVYSTSSRNCHYFLTPEGRQIANKLYRATKEALGESASSDPVGPIDSTHDYSLTHASDPRNMQRDSFMAILWPRGTYEIKLLLDNREVKSSNNRDYFSEQLSSNGIDVEVKTLPVGDVIWVAQHKETHQQVVIDYILERKRLDDLISSIKDGRFSEQKSRLRRSALKNVIYLVEEPKGMTAGVYRNHVLTAMSQSMVVDNFMLRRTNGPDETVKYLTSVTRQLEEMYNTRPLVVIYPHVETFRSSVSKAREQYQSGQVDPEHLDVASIVEIGIDYDSFNISLSKTGMFTIREVFLKMLMTIRGVSWDKAVAIQKVYPTPRDLFDAYNSEQTIESKKNMIYEALKDNISRKRVGKLLSEKIFENWGCKLDEA
ncbi:Mus81p [Sugiyamaella lignohabitans]|uniref:Crossover junction endonuclease MUS81 n=1 Tax=Sugiyamaella lignohabitans TaxID=796027 RepID=A0A161HHT1_9ASCO|nr:Mus81p [Sugiyamaella lignohabitans]ANB15640.1 Mus81p [Sugiyamaella lignohabitans]